MRVFTVPRPETLTDATGKEFTYGFSDLLTEYLWPAQEFRSGSLDAIEILESLEAKLGDPKPGDVIELTDKEYEFASPLITLRGKQLSPAFARPLSRLMRPVLRAKYAKESTQTPTPDTAA